MVIKDRTKRVVSVTDNLVPNKDIQFGYHSVSGKQIRITNNGLGAERMKPDSVYSDGVVYGAQPLKGRAEFEVEIVSSEAGWTESLGIGVMRCKKGVPIKSIDIPSHPYNAINHFVWTNNQLFNNLVDVAGKQRDYGYVDLFDIREGDCIGLRLSQDGLLEFTVNGKGQGLATRNIYTRDTDVYAFVNHWGKRVATVITKAGECRHNFIMLL